MGGEREWEEREREEREREEREWEERESGRKGTCISMFRVALERVASYPGPTCEGKRGRERGLLCEYLCLEVCLRWDG